MALPKEPRQKMINLMYLVLTALLALNVSAEILNAFKTVDHSLQNANGTIDQKNAQIFKSFQQKLNDPTSADRAKMWFPKADSARMLSDNLINYINSLKVDIKNAADFNPKDSTFREDNLEAATRVMSDPGTKGEELRRKLEDYRQQILALDPSINEEFAKDLPIDLSVPKSNNQSTKNSWASGYFNMVPTVAALTILSKFQNDIKNSEAMVVDFCHQKVGEVEVVYDQFKALTGTNSNYLMPGQELDITAGVGTYSSKAHPSVTVDGQSEPVNDSGYATFKSIVNSPGNYTKHVIISYTDQAGHVSTVEKDIPYTVGNPTGITVSADKVKVLYIGLQNPLTIQAGGVGAERVNASIDNGTLTKGQGGQYISEPAKAGIANITVFKDGKAVGNDQFRVKDVPDPIAMVGASKGGHMKANDFKAQVGVRADLENFVFEGVQFTVTGYTIVFNGAGFNDGLKFRQVRGNTFNDVQDLINQCRPGTTVTIDEIRANGPGGSRDLVPIVFNLQ